MIDTMNIEDLKCCGNCKHLEQDKRVSIFNETGCLTDSKGYCSDWEFDGMTKEERINF